MWTPRRAAHRPLHHRTCSARSPAPPASRPSTITTRRGRAGRRLRALWLLPAHLPDVRAVGRGDGLPARPDLPDEAGLEGEPLTDSMVGHFDACLGCMACVTACPSGVQYDRLIEDTRAQVERRHHPRRRATGRCARRSSSCSPTRGGCGSCAGRCARTRPAGCRRCVARSGLLQRLRADPVHAGLPRAAAAAGATRLPAGCRAARRPAGRRRHAHRVRPERVLPRGQRGDRAGARGRGLRGDHPATARLLRRVKRPQRTRGGGETVRARPDRHLRGEPDRLLRRQRRRLRVVPEGVRRPAARRTGDAERADDFAAKVRDLSEILVELGPVAERHPLRSPSPTTTPATWATPRACARSPVRCCAASPAWSCARSPTRRSAAVRPASGTCSTPSPPRSSAIARPAPCSPPTPQLLVTANPGCLCRWPRPCGRIGGPIALAHTAQVLDASIRGLPVEMCPILPSAPNVRLPCSTSSSHY